MRGYISIDYDDENQSSYKGVIVTYNANIKKVFNTGDFVKDWYNLNKFLEIELPNTRFTILSSVDHFLMDSDSFESSYLKFDDNELPYLTKVFDFKNQGVELFIKKGTNPTWKDLKKYCNNDNS